MKTTLILILLLAVAHAAPAATFVVNSTEDLSDWDGVGGCDATDGQGKCTLRAAIELSEDVTHGEADTIILPAGTFPITQYFGFQIGRYMESKMIEIVGAGARSTVIADTRPATNRAPYGLFRVIVPGELRLRGVTLENSVSENHGGAIRNEGDDNLVELIDVTIRGSRAANSGGAIANWGVLSLNRVTLTANSSARLGGAIFHNNGQMTLRNVTVSGNTASNGGGGIWFDAPATLTNVTVHGNSATSGSSAIGTFGGVTAEIANSIASGAGIACTASLSTTAANLATDSSCGFTVAADVRLGPLQDNGGQTDTHALLEGSAAIDAGSGSCAAEDQRGTSRPRGTACDLGAYESAFSKLPPTRSGVTAISTGRDLAASVAIQPDRRFVVAGEAQLPNATSGFAVVRYNRDETLDATFGSGGIVTTDVGPGSDAAEAVVIQPDGKILAAGFAGSFVALARYNPDGSLDATFGSGGKVLTSIQGQAHAVALEPDAQIVVAGETRGEGFDRFDFLLARFNSNGTLDSTFGAGGWVRTTVSERQDVARGVVIQPDGKMVTAGWGPPFVFALARYNADGSLDAGFGSGGVAILDLVPGRFDQAWDVALQSDGRIVAAGLATTPTGSDQFAAVRLLANGSLDPSFDGDGIGFYSVEGVSDAGAAVKIQPDDKIVLGGYALDDETFTWGFGLTRLNSNGSVDQTFGCGGTMTAAYDSADRFTFDLALDIDGSIIAVGSTYESSSTQDDFAVYRFDPFCSSSDGTPPTISAPFSTQPNAAGWNNGPVTVSWSIADDESSIVSSSGCDTVTLTEETAGTTLTCSATNSAGLTSAQSVTVRIDMTAPTVTFGAPGSSPNAHGWYSTDVMFGFNAADNLSGVAFTSSASPLVLSAEGTNVSGEVTVTDQAGNSATVRSAEVRIDKTAPTAAFTSRTPAANAHGWHNGDVSIAFSVSDLLSGVDTETATTAEASTSSPLVISGEGRDLSATVVVYDLAGNRAELSLRDPTGAINIDRTAPSANLGSRAPAANSNGWNNTDVTVNFTATDLLSGVDTAVTTASPQIISAEGRDLAITVEVYDLAGNVANVSLRDPASAIKHRQDCSGC